MTRVVLASGNTGKLKELSGPLADKGFSLLSQGDFNLDSADETGLTFVENALLKARHVCEQTGLAAIADDSGLAVDALGGQPGIHSARYNGENTTDAGNIDKLLKAMFGVPEAERSAQFHCVLVFMRHAADPVPVICQGIWEGRILDEACGDNGFGYDPVFWSPEFGRSAAELTREQKYSVSHRGKALQQLMERI